VITVLTTVLSLYSSLSSRNYCTHRCTHHCDPSITVLIMYSPCTYQCTHHCKFTHHCTHHCPHHCTHLYRKMWVKLLLKHQPCLVPPTRPIKACTVPMPLPIHYLCSHRIEGYHHRIEGIICMRLIITILITVWVPSATYPLYIQYLCTACSLLIHCSCSPGWPAYETVCGNWTDSQPDLVVFHCVGGSYDRLIPFGPCSYPPSSIHSFYAIDSLRTTILHPPFILLCY
jgi:hypothetical protein